MVFSGGLYSFLSKHSKQEKQNNMSNITDWINYELYPNLYYSIDKALPEFSFKMKGSSWVSTNNEKVTGERGEATGKVYVYSNNPGRLQDYTRGSSSIIDYYMEKKGLQFIDAVRALGNIVGLDLPQDPNYSSEEYKSYRDRATLLEDCSSYFTFCLEKSTGAKDVRDYLNTQRGYSSEVIKAMELGYIPSQEALSKHLVEKGHSPALIEGLFKTSSGRPDTRIGSTHSLAIPYRSGGIIRGFKFRAIGEDKPKYLNTPGLNKSGGLFNLSGIKGEKNLIIVEGELDALTATAQGIDNIVATTGNSINSEQIRDAIRRGAKSFTLCFDTEPGKEEATNKSLSSAISVILGEGVNRVYIVILPAINDKKTDVDSFIKERGVEALRKALKDRLPYYSYRLQTIIGKYGEIERAEGSLPGYEIDNFLEEVVETATQIKEPLHRDLYKELLLSQGAIKSLGITEDSLSITVDRIASTRDKQAQDKEVERLLSEATRLQEGGESSKALDLLESRVKQAKHIDRATEFSRILEPITEEGLIHRQRAKPSSLYSGCSYNAGTDEEEQILLPSGALSFFSAPTSHGKTTLLINSALNVIEGYPDKEFYLFSLEEDRDSILQKALNTYVNRKLSKNNRRSIKSYFSGKKEFIDSSELKYFERKKEEFFSEIVSPKRLNIIDQNYNSDDMIELIAYLHKNANPGAVFIDYIQLLNLPQNKYKTYSRQEELKGICQDLKDVAKETGLPIILGAQFNRQVTNHLKIHATQLGEAGDIERVANLILGFWNNNFKPLCSEGEQKEIEEKGIHKPNTLYVTTLKNRDGEPGLEGLLNFNGNIGKVENQHPAERF